MIKTTVLLVLLSGCFSRNKQTIAYAAGQAAIMCDWAMTRWMADRYDQGFVELNPILGRRPSPTTIDAVTIGALAVNTAIYAFAPNWFRAGWLPYVAILETANNLWFNPDGHQLCSR